MRKILASILTSVMLITVLVGCTQSTTDAITIASSGDDTVLLRDFLYVFGASKAQDEMWLSMMFSEEEIVEHWLEIDEEGITQLERLKESSLRTVLDQATLLRLAQDAGYTYDTAELRERENTIDDIIMRLHSPERRGEDIFFDFYMITPQDFKDMQPSMLTVDAFINSVTDSIPVNEEEVQAFVEENRAWIEQQFELEATARHILINSNDGMTEEERTNATILANEILERVQAGEAIGELAAIYSEDPGSAHNNGEYTFPRGMMVAEFENWAFSAQSGDIGMVETTFGYHIMYSVDAPSITEEHLQEIRIMLAQEELHETMMNKIQEADMNWVINEEILQQILASVIELDTNTETY